METYIYNKTISIITTMLITKSITTGWHYLKKIKKIRKFVSKKKNKIHDVKELISSPIVKTG